MMKNYYGCVDELPQGDDRLPEFLKQREERGFDDTETWNLDVTIIEFVTPRLRRYLELSKETIVRNDFVEDMEFVLKIFDKILSEEINYFSPENEKEIDKALELFFKHFRKLWW